MSNTTPAKPRAAGWTAAVLGLGLCLALAAHHPANAQQPKPVTSAPTPSETLTARQQSIVPIAAFAAAGDIAKLNAALNSGLDAGLTVNDAKEVLVQLYAYAGFPRSLNALGELMKVLDERKQRGSGGHGRRAPARRSRSHHLDPGRDNAGIMSELRAGPSSWAGRLGIGRLEKPHPMGLSWRTDRERGPRADQ